MKSTANIILLIGWILGIHSTAQAQYFQQKVDYDIAVQLDTAQKMIRGEMTMTYHNHADHPLSEIQLHLWANAYSTRKSHFSLQNLAANNDKFFWATDLQKGGYEKIEFRQEGTELSWDHPEDNLEYVNLQLAEAVSPGDSIEIAISFTQKIPFIFSRGGWGGNFFALTQWYPKAAVYDQEGWHLFPYLEMGEYYADFGDYRVEIEVPDSFLLAATGVVIDSVKTEEGRLKKTFDAKNVVDFAWFTGENMIKEHKTITLTQGEEVDLHYYAPKRYPLNNVKVADSLVPQVEGVINNNISPIEMLERSLRYYSENVAPYPYPQATVVIGPLNTGSGMEYPMITLIGPTRSAEVLDRVIAHEAGHNWFQAILGFNERKSPYLDEGINSFYENKYMDTHYGRKTYPFQVMAARTALSFEQFLYQGSYQRGDIVPVNSHSHDMDQLQYYFNGYMIPPSLFNKLEEVTGPEQFQKNIREFYEKYKFTHPDIDDLREIFEKNDPDQADFSWFFDDMLSSVKTYDIAISDVDIRGDQYVVTLKNEGEIKAPVTLKAFDGKKVVHTETVEQFDKSAVVRIPLRDYDYIAVDKDLVIERSPENNSYEFIPVRKQKFINPVAGLKNPGVSKIWYYPFFNFNHTDGFIFGAGLHNITLPGNNLEFFVQPGFGVKSNSWTGMAGMEYYIPKNNSRIRYFNFGWSAKHFSYDQIVAGNDFKEVNLSYWRINPHFKISFQPQNKFKPWYHTLLIDAPVVGVPSTYLTNENGEFEKTQLDWRVYPRAHYQIKRYSPVNNIELNLKAEFLSYTGAEDKNQNYLKTTAELKTDYAYAPGTRIFGRFFVGGFPVNSARNAENVAEYDVPGTLGVSSQAYHDYSYDGYFIDRSERSDKLWARQIRIEDGGFKNYMGADYARVTGNSNSFLAAANFSADLPYIGSKVPLKPFFDLALYQDATPNGAGSTFLYSGGLMLGRDNWPVSIYLPLIASRDITDIHKERGNIWKRLSFRLSLEDWGVSKKLRDTPMSQLGILQ